MDLHIATHDGVPIYLQIVNQVKYLVASGRLAPGEELPPIRVLAEAQQMGIDFDALLELLQKRNRRLQPISSSGDSL